MKVTQGSLFDAIASRNGTPIKALPPATTAFGWPRLIAEGVLVTTLMATSLVLAFGVLPEVRGLQRALKDEREAAYERLKEAERYDLLREALQKRSLILNAELVRQQEKLKRSMRNANGEEE